jgi:hypothetical protein
VREGVFELSEFEGALAPIDIMLRLLSRQAGEGQNRPVKKAAN